MYDPKLDLNYVEPFFTKSTRKILSEDLSFTDPSRELVKWIDSYLDSCESGPPMIKIWYFILGFSEKELMFIANNFMESFSVDKKNYYIDFFNKTKDLPNQKEIAIEYIKTNDLDSAIESCKKESFDLSLLDFLTDKINDDKMLNWGVGQVMKQYPKRFSPQEVKEALQKKFLL